MNTSHTQTACSMAHAQSLASFSVLLLPTLILACTPQCSLCAQDSMPKQLGWVAGAHVSHAGAPWLWQILPPQDPGWQSQRQQFGQGMLFQRKHTVAAVMHFQLCSRLNARIELCQVLGYFGRKLLKLLWQNKKCIKC